MVVCNPLLYHGLIFTWNPGREGGGGRALSHTGVGTPTTFGLGIKSPKTPNQKI